ncbi:hypothetical protein PVAP13_9NG043200 [Panicum virgatum]|uniref:Uncharacterized protein n=1 Tax=Panicum virgatum TaxID=38727 RepID=A0A8T0MDD5_PANVG|nr:hypothetical protein PVAP13_9NG043200 [Panicum virgatum]
MRGPHKIINSPPLAPIHGGSSSRLQGPRRGGCRHPSAAAGCSPSASSSLVPLDEQSSLASRRGPDHPTPHSQSPSLPSCALPPPPSSLPRQQIRRPWLRKQQAPKWPWLRSGIARRRPRCLVPRGRTGLPLHLAERAAAGPPRRGGGRRPRCPARWEGRGGGSLEDQRKR